jgi:hypothetical protein
MVEATGNGIRADAEVEGLLSITLGRITATLDRMDQRERAEVQLWQDVHPVPILGQGLTGLVAANGVIDTQNRMGPNDPFWWDVRRLSCWGFTAGTVNVYLNDATGNGELLAPFPQPGQWSWSGQLFLAPRDRLVAIATGVTGSVFLAGQATEVASTMMPRYQL